MIDDPIVREIHETRRRIMEECGGDVERLIAMLKAGDEQHKDRLVTMEEVQRRAGSRPAALYPGSCRVGRVREPHQNPREDSGGARGLDPPYKLGWLRPRLMVAALHPVTGSHSRGRLCHGGRPRRPRRFAPLAAGGSAAGWDCRSLGPGLLGSVLPVACVVMGGRGSMQGGSTGSNAWGTLHFAPATRRFGY